MEQSTVNPSLTVYIKLGEDKHSSLFFGRISHEEKKFLCLSLKSTRNVITSQWVGEEMPNSKIIASQNGSAKSPFFN